MSFSFDQISKIPHILSEPRFATYLQHCDNDRTGALRLYKWNLELSSAFIIPLHLLEISIRNAVVECLEIIYTSNWPWNRQFIRSLPDPQRGYSPRRLSENSLFAHDCVAQLKKILNVHMYASEFSFVSRLVMNENPILGQPPREVRGHIQDKIEEWIKG